MDIEVKHECWSCGLVWIDDKVNSNCPSCGKYVMGNGCSPRYDPLER